MFLQALQAQGWFFACQSELTGDAGVTNLERNLKLFFFFLSTNHYPNPFPQKTSVQDLFGGAGSVPAAALAGSTLARAPRRKGRAICHRQRKTSPSPPRQIRPGRQLHLLRQP